MRKVIFLSFMVALLASLTVVSCGKSEGGGGGTSGTSFFPQVSL